MAFVNFARMWDQQLARLQCAEEFDPTLGTIPSFELAAVGCGDDRMRRSRFSRAHAADERRQI